MKVPVLKALANPARIFFVPYNLAVFNFVILFFAYVIIFVITLMVSSGKDGLNPLYFLFTLILIHSILAVWTKKEPFLLRIFMAKVALFRKKVPKKMVV